MKIHFIAVGGSVMHNLAIALHKKGYKISGSDDEIFEPAKSRLRNYNLLPQSAGWDPGKITPSLDAVILGMHARKDNPELQKAKELGIKIFSFPEYLYEQTKDKIRIVIAGSHGKTTITSMIMHSLKNTGYKFDYMSGALVEGFNTMVELNDENKIAVFEGDEYFTSAIDPRPKFHLYKPHISLITGIAWDHINVFPTFENYVEQFEIFAGLTSHAIIYYEGDELLSKILKKHSKRLDLYPYRELQATPQGKTSLVDIRTIEKLIASESKKKYPENIKNKISENRKKNFTRQSLEPQADLHNNLFSLNIFGKHNFQNLSGAMQVCNLLGLGTVEFLNSMKNFSGAAKRQEHLAGNDFHDVYLDFAHSPSKVKATVESFKSQFYDKKLIACLELHTFSSLNPGFLPHYKDTLNAADKAIVFYDPKVVKHKQLPEILPDQLIPAFNRKDLIIINDPLKIEDTIMNLKPDNSILLLMTSGNLSGLDIRALAVKYINK